MPPNINGGDIYSNTDELDCNNYDNQSLKNNHQLMEKHYDADTVTAKISNKLKDLFTFKTELIWTNIIAIFLLHFAWLYCILTFPFNSVMTVIWYFVAGYMGAFGVTGGAHRYFAHRSYKAKLPLRIILVICYCMAGQNSIYNWVRDHRVHHKFTETDADPHNTERGFFFSHVGWLMMKKHPEVIKQGKKIDMSDITSDPVVAFAEKYFLPLKILFAFVIPSVVPVYFWNETWYNSIVSQVILRYTASLNGTWSVNSIAHFWGSKPYDKTIKPVENVWVSISTIGEGWHNYHHVFPWDYKAAELGNYAFNLTTAFIDGFAKIGWAYDLKEPSRQVIDEIIAKKGDGTYCWTDESAKNAESIHQE